MKKQAIFSMLIFVFFLAASIAYAFSFSEFFGELIDDNATEEPGMEGHRGNMGNMNGPMRERNMHHEDEGLIGDSGFYEEKGFNKEGEFKGDNGPEGNTGYNSAIGEVKNQFKGHANYDKEKGFVDENIVAVTGQLGNAESLAFIEGSLKDIDTTAFNKYKGIVYLDHSFSVYYGLYHVASKNYIKVFSESERQQNKVVGDLYLKGINYTDYDSNEFYYITNLRINFKSYDVAARFMQLLYLSPFSGDIIVVFSTDNCEPDKAFKQIETSKIHYYRCTLSFDSPSDLLAIV